jgi:hypothetical protein
LKKPHFRRCFTFSASFLPRSVDSIARIYAVVTALAISQTVQTFLKDSNGNAILSIAGLTPGGPALVAFLSTLVPFWHGMNRHLDRCYLEKKETVVRGALLFDFAVFFCEASLLFAAGLSLRSGLRSFYVLGLLLLVDMVWGFISHQIHFPGKKSYVVRWSSINLAAGALAFFIVIFPFDQKAWALTVVAILRSITDYALCWRFYFPDAKEAGSEL